MARNVKRCTLQALKVFMAAFTAFALFVMFTPAANMLAWPLIVSGDIKRSDLIVVLGGGAYENGALGGASNERFLRGIMLLKDGYARRIIFSGGSITGTPEKVMRTVLKKGGPEDIDVSEAEVMYSAAAKLGLPRGSLARDPVSTNTFENLRNAGEYMAAKGLKRCLIVTSATHMRRAIGVSEKLGMDCAPAPVADYTRYRKGAVDRLSLFREVAWEYAGLVLYKLYGYI